MINIVQEHTKGNGIPTHEGEFGFTYTDEATSKNYICLGGTVWEEIVKNRVVEVTSSRDFLPSDDDAILLIKNNVTLTFVAGLSANFSVNIFVRGAFTATLEAGSEICHFTDGFTLDEDDICLIFRSGSEFIVKK